MESNVMTVCFGLNNYFHILICHSDKNNFAEVNYL